MKKSSEKLLNKLLKSDLNDPEIVRAIFDLARNEEDVELGRKVRGIASEQARVHAKEPNGKVFVVLYWDIMLWLAPHDFDSYMIYLEKNRKPADRFYQPRRKQLKPIVDAFQELKDNKLDQLFISLPPRVGKTTIVSFAFSWQLGRRPDLSNLYSSYGGYVTKTFYNGMLEIILDDNTYCWSEIFPESKLAATDAQDLRIDIERRKKYPTLTCRSIDGALNGGADCQGWLCGDDLVEGIEEAMSPDRLAKKWSVVLNNLFSRQVGAIGVDGDTGKTILCGTRWSLYDPIGRQIELLESNPDYANIRWKSVVVPALDENEESNFDYEYGKGMTTAQYKQRRAAMEEAGNIADWEAQYMNNPIERNGQLFDPTTMRFYNGVLPEEEPDRIFSFVDVAFGGGDYVSAPVAYQYGDAVYIHDVVFNNGDKYVTRPLIVGLFKRNNVGSACFEGTKTTDDYREWIDTKLQADGIRINIMTKAASTRKRKEERIFEKAPEIREFYYRDASHRSPEYAAFMRNVQSFTMTGKNKWDDGPDSLAGLCDMIRRSAFKARVIQRPF